MPSKTRAQARLMAGAAHSKSFAKKVGVPQSVARDFNAADAGTSILNKLDKPPPQKKRAPAFRGRTTRRYTSA